MDLYSRIRECREALGMTQDELAIKMGYKDRSTIAKIESGKNDITQSKIKAFAEALHTTPSYLMGWDVKESDFQTSSRRHVSVLGDVAAGLPMEVMENIIDYEEISEALASTGDFFALRVKGTSMEPRMKEGDVVIIRKQEDATTGDTVVVLVNGDSATIKTLKKSGDGLSLIPNNPAFNPAFYTNKEIATLPITILGKVVELRAKF